MASSNFRVKNGLEVTEVLYVSGASSLRNVGILGAVDPDVAGLTVHGDISATGTIFVAGSAVGSGGGGGGAGNPAGGNNTLQYNNNGVFGGATDLNYNETLDALGIGVVANEKLTVGGNISATGNIIVDGTVDGRDIAGDIANVVSNSASWNSAYSTTQQNSADWNYVAANSGFNTDTAIDGRLTVGSDTVLDNNQLTVVGSISALGTIYAAGSALGGAGTGGTPGGANNTFQYNDSSALNGGDMFYDETNTSVGIGTSTPNVKLAVVGAISSTNVVYTSSSNSTNWDDTYKQVSDSTTDLAVDTNTLYVDKSENKVGIGTSSPNKELTVIGSISSKDIFIGDVSPVITIKDTDSFGDTQLGYIQFTDTNDQAKGSIGFTNASDKNLRFTNNTEGDVRFLTNSAVSVAITSAGRVGIGTTSPAEALTVVGDISASGSITVANNTYKFADGEAFSSDSLTDIKSVSATWDSAYTSLKANSAEYESVYATVQATSSEWADNDADIAVIASASGNWDTAYTHSQGSVTDHSDVSDAGSGEIITSAERADFTSTKSTVNTYSADWNYVAANSAFTLDDVTGNGNTTSNNITVGDATVTGDLTVQGATIQADTVVTVTSALSVTNIGTGPALHVEQTGNNKVAEFLDDGEAVLTINNGGNITVKDSATVDGRDISADGILIDRYFDDFANIANLSGRWNRTESSMVNDVRPSSANWNTAYTDTVQLKASSGNWNTGYTHSQGSVTDHSDVSNAGSGQIITSDERDRFGRTWTITSNNSGNWTDGYNVSNSLEVARANIASTSATWDQAYLSVTTDVKDNSGSWDSAYNTTKSNSADWNYTAANSAAHANEFSFKTITLSANRTGAARGADIVADTTTDTLTLCAGPNIELISEPGSDVITISGSVGGGSGGVSFNSSEIAAASAGYTRTEDSLVNDIVPNSASWDQAYLSITTDVKDNSARWDTNSNTEIAANSADWNYTASNTAVSVAFDVTNNGSGAYRFNNGGFTNDDNPTLHLQRGKTYRFRVNASGHPFLIKTQAGTGTANQYLSGVTGAGAAVGNVDFEVRHDAPRQLFYQCQAHSGMVGAIHIGDATATTEVFNNSANWNTAYTTSNNNFSTLNSNSARWDTNANTELAAISARYTRTAQSLETNVVPNTADWNYTAANSAITLETSSHDYLSISNREITLGQVDISDDTNLAAGDGVTLTGDTLSIDSVSASNFTTAYDHSRGSVTDHTDVSNAGSGQIITSDERDRFGRAWTNLSTNSADYADHFNSSEVAAVSANWNRTESSMVNDVASTSANWDGAYTHSQGSGSDHSLLGATAGTASAGKALIVDSNKDIDFDGGDITATNVTVQGDLTVQGATVQADTIVTVTSALSVTNTGTGPALHVEQTGNNKVVEFLDDGTAVFSIANGGNITVKDGATVDSRDISVDGINLDNTKTTVDDNSANWNTAYTHSQGSVTDHNDVSNAGSGQIITSDERDRFGRTWTNLSTNSSQWAEVKADIAEVAALSATWNDAATNAYAVSADIAEIAALSANWNRTESSMVNDVAATSANWNTAYTHSQGNVTDHADVSNAGSGAIITTDERDKFTRNWTNVSTSSASWNDAATNAYAVSADIAEIAALSANWNTAYTRSDGTVTIHNDVSNAGSGQIITTDERDRFGRAWTNLSTNSADYNTPFNGSEIAAASARYTQTALSVETNVVPNTADWNYTAANSAITLDTSSHNYLSISNREITLGEVDISDDTNLAANNGVTLTGDTLSIDSVSASNFTAAYDHSRGNVTDHADVSNAGSGKIITDGERTKLHANWTNLSGSSANWDTAYTHSQGSVTDHNDVSNAGSGQIITTAERNNLNSGFSTTKTNSADWNYTAANSAITLETSSHNYLSISNREITLGEVDISDDTNLAANNGVTLTGDTLSIDSVSASNFTAAYDHSRGSVTDHTDVSNAGSGQIITSDERDRFGKAWTNISSNSADYADHFNSSEIAAASARYTQTALSLETNVVPNTADWNYVAANSALTLDDVTGNGGTTSNNIQVGDATITGDLTVQGATIQADTVVTVTSALSVTNTGTGPALHVEQTGNNKVVEFLDDGVSVFSIANGGNITVKDSATVDGRDISADGILIDRYFNDFTDISVVSGKWNRTERSMVTDIRPNSANWNTAYTHSQGNVTDHADVSNAGSGQIITTDERDKFTRAWTNISTNSADYADHFNSSEIAASSARYTQTAVSLETNVIPSTADWNYTAANSAITLDTSSHNYLSISDREITVGEVDISDDTNLAANNGITLTGDTLSIDSVSASNFTAAYDHSRGNVTDHADVSNAGSGKIITDGERTKLHANWTNLSGSSANWDTAYTHSQGNVTDHADVSNAGSGKIITDGERTKLHANWTNLSGSSANWDTAYTHSQGNVTDHADVSNAGSGAIITTDERDKFTRNWTNVSTSSANWNSTYNQVQDSSTDLNIDSNTLVVDKSENRVGIGTAAPDALLTVAGSISSSGTLYSRGIQGMVDDITLDAEGDIILDANGADIKLKDNGTEFGRLSRVSSDLVIKSTSNNNDIVFKGVDNTATITAMTIDMSEAGKVGIGTTAPSEKLTVIGNISATGNATVNGNIVVDGTVDGRDVAADGITTDNNFTTVNSNSASWTTAYNSTQTELKSNSADWNYTAANSAITLETSSHDYLSISNREITLGEIDISDDTNLAANNGVTLTGDTLSIDSVSASNFTAAYDHSRGSVTDHTDVSNAGSGQIITSDERDRFGKAWTNISSNSADYADHFNSSEIAAASARYTQTALSLETNVVPNTADWNYVAANSGLTLDDITGNGATTSNNIQVGDATITGDLTVQGATIQADTVVTVTSALSVTNTGTGPALHVEQKGNNKVVEFLDDGTAIFSIANGGAITVGTWNGTAIANDYVAALPTSKITSGTFANARIASSNVTQHQGDITGTGALNSGSITSGFGNINNGTSSLTTGAVIAQQLRVTTTSAPSAYTSSGTKGDIAYDTNYLYICVSNNSWRRVALAIWE